MRSLRNWLLPAALVLALAPAIGPRLYDHFFASTTTATASAGELENLVQQKNHLAWKSGTGNVASVTLGTPEFVVIEDVPLVELTEKYKKEHPGAPARKKIVVSKAGHDLGVYLDDTLLKSYPVVLGRRPRGDKKQEGDMRTPEGNFYAAWKNPNSKYHQAIGLSYPGTEDAIRGTSTGLISEKEGGQIKGAIKRFGIPPQTTQLGSYLEIHGPVKGRTYGCIAMKTHVAIEEVFAFTQTGGDRRTQTPHTLIQINP
tara:strand:- start:181 stop:951 length:771 start_codon:yes stop_codon:yes gene_type:complete